MTHLRYHVRHETHYHYSAPVVLSQQLLHLTPRVLPWQARLQHDIRLEPEPSESECREDYFGNPVTRIALLAPHQSLGVHAQSVVEVASREAATRPGPSEAWDAVREKLRRISPAPLLEAAQFLYDSPQVECAPALGAYARPSFALGRPLLDAVEDLNRRIFKDFEFDPRATTIATPLARVLAERRGVCQDFAHLMIGCLRTLGLAARYVSGYILTAPPPGQPRLIGADASHAWLSVFCPGNGWVDFDPTNNRKADNEHVTLAWGRDFSDVTPMRGVILGGGEQELEVRVTVTPVSPSPFAARAADRHP